MRACDSGSDSKIPIVALLRHKSCLHSAKETSQPRCARELKSTAFDIIREKTIIETNSEDLKAVLKRGDAAANNYLRRLPS